MTKTCSTCGCEDDGLGFNEDGIPITDCDRCREEKLEREDRDDD